MIRTVTNLYLRTDYFEKVFGLKCTFNFRSLSVILTTTVELPVVREKRLETMRNNISRLNGEIKADTSIGRSYPFFSVGMADWSASITQYLPGKNSTQLNLALGSVLAGGEVGLTLNYDNNTPLTLKDQYYQWSAVNNEHSGLRQVVAGKLYTQSVSSLFAPVVGIQMTNTPTTYRRSFGTYRLSNHTDPGWTVELYVNNELINYVKADASGFFTFEVPLVYGNSVVKLRFYGPWGEERTSEQNISIPFNFLPRHQLEYTVSAGIVEDSLNSRFSRIDFHYGLSRRLTLGGGFEYLSSVTSGKNIPFLNASVRLLSDMLITAEYDYGVQSKMLLSYHLPSNLQVDLNYTRYNKGQTAINNTYLEERKAVITLPLHGKNFSAFSRLTLYQVLLPSSRYTTAEGLISGVAFGLNTNLTTYAMFTESAPAYVYSDLSMVFKLPAKLSLTPDIQYEYSQQKVIGLKGELGKYISPHSFLTLSYEDNFKSRFQSIGLEFHYDFSFAQTGFAARRTNAANTILQSVRGSLLYDPKTRYVGLGNSTSVGKGGVIILPYLDLNNNGKYDKGEPKVPGFKIQINSGHIQYNKTDTIIRISGLEAYTSYTVKLLPSFNNIALQIKKLTISITIDPNLFKILEVPVTVINEVSGTVYLKRKNEEKGQGRIMVCFYNSDATLAGRILTETDGFFNFSGLTAGSYTARIDSAQLCNLKMTVIPNILHFTIKPNKDGDLIDGLQFILEPLVSPGLY
jgi:hypothetical protein